MSNNVFLSTLLNMCLMVVLAYFMTENRMIRYLLRDTQIIGERRLEWKRKMSIGIIMGMFCIISNTIGHMVEGSIPNSRVIGALTAGLLGGPISGMLASVIGAVHRYMIEPARISTPACVTATLIQGVMGSLCWYWKKKKANYSYSLLFLLTGTAEILHMLLIYMMIDTKGAAIEILNIIAWPMIVFNSIGMVLLFKILNDKLRQEDQAAAAVVGQAMERVSACMPYLRHDGTLEEQRERSEKIIEILLQDDLYCGAAVVWRDELFATGGAFSSVSNQHFRRTALMNKVKTEKRAVMVRGNDEGILLNDPWSSLYRKYTAAAVPVQMEDLEMRYLLVLMNGDLHSIRLGMTYLDSLAQFFETYGRIFEAQRQKEMLRKAELQLLQSQINPHFLFNALNTISFFCREKPERARELLLALSRYFRNTLREADAMVTLNQELDQVRSYLMLEEARFEERLQVEYAIDPETLETMVPNLILQPLVENAVRHGAMTQRLGHVKICIAKCADGVRLCVMDNGPGFTPEAEASLVTGISVSKSGTGIGMLNVHRRLKGIWEGNPGLRYERQGEWTCVSAEIPSK